VFDPHFQASARLREVIKFPGWISRMIVNQCHSHRLRRSRNAMESTDDHVELMDREVMWQNHTSAIRARS